MQWTDETYLGFSEVEPWLMSQHPNRSINVAQQEQDPDSILHYYRKLTGPL